MDIANHKAFVAVTVHFEIEGVPMSMLLDLKEVVTSHSGVNLAYLIVMVSSNVLLVLTELQVLGITCDNASPNDTMIEELPKLIAAFPGSANHTRCFDHVLALVAKRIVCQFDVAVKMMMTTMTRGMKGLKSFRLQTVKSWKRALDLFGCFS
jgi:hypothetical protein